MLLLSLLQYAAPAGAREAAAVGWRRPLPQLLILGAGKHRFSPTRFVSTAAKAGSEPHGKA